MQGTQFRTPRARAVWFAAALCISALPGITVSPSHAARIGTAPEEAQSSSMASAFVNIAPLLKRLRTEAPSSDPDTPVRAEDGVFDSAENTSRFLSSATFGARTEDINVLTGNSASQWFLAQLEEEPSYTWPAFEELQARYEVEDEDDFFWPFSPNTVAFWEYAIEGEDQLRQRMVYALSQLLVVSDFGGELLTDYPSAIAYYRDILTEHAFGNYRDLLEAVTYSPAMGYYLTYLGNLPQDDRTGRMPDENYAREILQLFTIGLVELNPDGTPRLDGDGNQIETYGNEDVTGLARVFTGLDLDEAPYSMSDDFAAELARPMRVFDEQHSLREKRFLGTSIPAGTPGEESLRLALDHIMAHPNVGPFIGRQLIQRFTTSNPSPLYVERVASAFDVGLYVLPDNTTVGTGRKGDLAATLAAVLFDEEALSGGGDNPREFGKPREPVLRFTQWARAFEVDASRADLKPILWETLGNDALAQHPHRSRSVFNFYRPGYVAPGSLTGEAQLTVPELQIVNASSTPGYVNFMTYFIFAIPGESEEDEIEELLEIFEDELGIDLDLEAAEESFAAFYDREIELAGSPEALVAHLNLLLAGGRLEADTQLAIRNLISDIPLEWGDGEGAWLRTVFAVLMTMTSPDYLVQR